MSSRIIAVIMERDMVRIRARRNDKLTNNSPAKPSGNLHEQMTKASHSSPLLRKRPQGIKKEQPQRSSRKNNRSTSPQDKERKQKRAQEAEKSPIRVPSKRPRKSVAPSAFGDIFDKPAADGVVDNKINPIAYWIQKERWPKECFDQDEQTRRDFEKDSWLEKYWEPESNMSHILARRKSSSSLRGKQSEANSASSSDQKPRDVKSALYQDAHYETILATKGSFMGKSELVLQLQARAFPSAEILAIRGAKHLKILSESVNESWNSSIPITKTRPQPDYSVVFRRESFTEDELKRIEPFVGELTDTSFFMGTMTMAVRGIVELFRLVKREKELHREILAFSISHDHRTVRIYGHYPVIDGEKTTFYRYAIREFSVTELGGKEKWTAYKFTKNVYDKWMPTHLKRICSIIDELPPDLDFEVSQQSEPGESGLSQGLESHHLSDQTCHDAASLGEADSQSSRVESREVTPDTSLSQRIEGGAFKKPRKRGRPVELHQSQDAA
ncbi:hypothetical protein LSUE1_G002964 [Lachnellula suecica]|uniref:DUF7924 domain-containing protein n=1 Tax=Lachnellula suecica TaxID=602035 RepID=A0A8T9CE00_9HELO|nr:hypothetical protein LSUE1_G002964 [Lachnellula suecica]